MKDRKTKIWECLFFLTSLLFLVPFLLLVHQIWKVSYYQELMLQKLCLEKYSSMKIYYRLILSYFVRYYYYYYVGKRPVQKLCNLGRRDPPLFTSRGKEVGITIWLWSLRNTDKCLLSAGFTKRNISLVRLVRHRNS